MFNWLFIVQVLPTMTASVGWATLLIFAIANALFILIIYFFYPEPRKERSRPSISSLPRLLRRRLDRLKGCPRSV
jgi:hypothetical protein